MMIKRRAISYLFIPFCFLFLTACGGSGGGGTAAPVTTPTTTPTTVSGKLVPDVRTTGYSARYKSDPNYKATADAFLVAMRDFVKGVESDIKWPSDVPVVFSGCGTLNAFFSPGIDLHDNFKNRAVDPVVDPAAVFGPNVTVPAIVMCHEITETNLLTFLTDAATLAKIKTVFNVTTDQEAIPGALASALLFELQILFHELGHAFDTLLLKDPGNAIKMANFTIPIPNSCAATNCDTAANDFADWISAAVLIQVLQGQIKTDIDAASELAKAWLVALDAWTRIVGAGGGVAHGLTTARQINMLCYAYGAIPELRQADATVLGNGLANAISAEGVGLATCETTFNRNNASTTTLLGSFIN